MTTTQDKIQILTNYYTAIFDRIRLDPHSGADAPSREEHATKVIMQRLSKDASSQAKVYSAVQAHILDNTTVSEAQTQQYLVGLDALEQCGQNIIEEQLEHHNIKTTAAYVSQANTEPTP